jgi:linoleate 10R-lipoxygenase
LPFNLDWTAAVDPILACSCFRTNHEDWTINDTSSYVDLSPLYGNSLEAQLKLRRLDGTGLMWNDVFAEDRLLFLPPISCTLLVIFCRNHNFIAGKLLEINEKSKFTNPPPADPNAMRSVCNPAEF